MSSQQLVEAVENVDLGLPKKQEIEQTFKKLKLGRPRRKARAWFTSEELRMARRILNFFAHIPPACVCGERDWTFNVKDDQLRTRCRRCKYEQTFMVPTKCWTLDPRE